MYRYITESCIDKICNFLHCDIRYKSDKDVTLLKELQDLNLVGQPSLYQMNKEHITIFPKLTLSNVLSPIKL